MKRHGPAWRRGVKAVTQEAHLQGRAWRAPGLSRAWRRRRRAEAEAAKHRPTAEQKQLAGKDRRAGGEGKDVRRLGEAVGASEKVLEGKWVRFRLRKQHTKLAPTSHLAGPIWSRDRVHRTRVRASGIANLLFGSPTSRAYFGSPTSLAAPPHHYHTFHLKRKFSAARYAHSLIVQVLTVLEIPTLLAPKR